MRLRRGLLSFLIFTVIAGLAGVMPVLADEIVIGWQCDRTGPTKFVGTIICPGMGDYIKLANKKKILGEHTLKVMEVEHAYKVDRGVEAYERIKRAGGVATFDYGTPIVYALTQRHMEDKIPGLTPGFGRADAADGERFPYIFPIAASYWSQGGAAMKFVKDNGAQTGSKIAYIYYDNPAGREPLPIVRRVCELEGYKCREFAVPPPGVEMSTAVSDIARRFRADWVVAHLFGKSPGIAIKEFRKNGYPLDKIVSLVWGAGEQDMLSAGGWDKAQGYLGMQFAGVGRDFPVIQEIIQMYKDEGEEVPDIVGQVYYNRGVFVSSIVVEGVRLAIENFGLPVTGEKVKQAYEMIQDYTLGGFLPPMTVTPQDHEGGGWVRIYQTQGEEFVPHTDWFQGYRDLVLDQVKKAGQKKQGQ